MESYRICRFVTGLFHVVWYSQHSPNILARGRTSFLGLNNIPLYVYPTFCLSFIYWWVFGLLPFLGYCAAMNRVWSYLFETWISILLDIYPKVGSLEHMVVLFLICQGNTYQGIYHTIPYYHMDECLVHRAWHYYIILPTCTRVSVSPYPHQHLLLLFLIVTNSNRCEVITHCGVDCFSLIIREVEHLFHVIVGQSLYHLWRNIFSIPLPTF